MLSALLNKIFPSFPVIGFGGFYSEKPTISALTNFCFLLSNTGVVPEFLQVLGKIGFIGHMHCKNKLQEIFKTACYKT